MTVLTGICGAAISGFAPLGAIAKLADAGAPCAFIVVVVGMLLRLREPPRQTSP
jgi:hypothetical protein